VKLRVLTSTPLQPLATEAASLCRRAELLWIATAFASEAAVEATVECALRSKSDVRFLTGVFGNTTRLRTFRRLYQLTQTQPLEARIWNGDFHAKLLIWRRGQRGIAWVGSANLTDRGLSAQGEVMAEIRLPWESAPMRQLRRAFLAEWNRAEPLDRAFLAHYKESPRAAQLLTGTPRAPVKRAVSQRARRRGVMFVAPVSRYYEDGSGAASRIERLFAGTADSWYRSSIGSLGVAKPGDFCLIVDTIERAVGIFRITDRKRDGRAWVISYERLTGAADRRLSSELRRLLSRVGVRRAGRGFRSGWLPAAIAADVAAVVYGPHRRARMLKELGLR
jgi:HKD family nuclease